MFLCESPHVNNERIKLLTAISCLRQEVSKSFISVLTYFGDKRKKAKLKLYAIKE